MLPEHVVDEFGAGPVGRIVKFLSAPVGFEVNLILTAQEGALVVIKPPVQARIAGILEIHDSVFIAVKLHIQKKLPGAMGKPLVFKLTILSGGSQIIAENSCGSQTIEAVVMKVYLHYPHTVLDCFSQDDDRYATGEPQECTTLTY